MADTDKNIYSLVLSDDVIDEIDSMARSAGLSRSAMVNQILAEKTRCITPEMRVKQITNAIREAVGGEFYLAQQPSPATVACRTALKYRYKPTLRYSVELFAVARKRTGELKVSVRSQSGQLNDDLTGFFQCWVKLEQKYLADKIQQWLLEEFEDNGDTVMFAPGAPFYETPGKGINEVRIAYVLKQEDLERAMDVLAIGISEYQRKVMKITPAPVG